MFGKKAKELELLLTQRNHENELMRKRIGELEAEVSRLQDQEKAVLKAITEADKTATRIVDEANANAQKITNDANETYVRMVSEAKQRVCDAAKQANDILAQADSEAKSIRADADDYSDKTRADADVYSENTRTDVNIYVERSIMAAQMEVKKRKDVLAELNTLLRSTADFVSDQVLTFTDAIETSAKEAETSSADMCREIEKCSCSCKDCEEPCINKAEAPEAAPAEETNAAQPEEAPIPEEAPAEEPAEDEPHVLMSAGSMAGDDEEELAELEGTGDEDAEPDPEDDDEGCRDPRELMHKIYDIEGRVIPLDSLDDELSDSTPDGGLAFDDELGGTPFDPDAAVLPGDEKLSSVLSEVLDN